MVEWKGFRLCTEKSMFVSSGDDNVSGAVVLGFGLSALLYSKSFDFNTNVKLWLEFTIVSKLIICTCFL